MASERLGAADYKRSGTEVAGVGVMDGGTSPLLYFHRVAHVHEHSHGLGGNGETFFGLIVAGGETYGDGAPGLGCDSDLLERDGGVFGIHILGVRNC